MKGVPFLQLSVEDRTYLCLSLPPLFRWNSFIERNRMLEHFYFDVFIFLLRKKKPKSSTMGEGMVKR